MTQWFYNNGEKPAGPLDHESFVALIHDGSIKAETLVWCSEMDDWAPLSETESVSEIPEVRAEGERPKLQLRGRMGADPVQIDPTPEGPSARSPESEGSRLTMRRMAPAAEAAPGPQQPPPQAASLPGQSIGSASAAYDGKAGELFPLYLKNIVLTVLTLGVYRFWAQVNIRRYHEQHTSFAGGRFDYHATGRERLLGFLRALLILLPLCGGLYFAYRYVETMDPAWAGTATLYTFLLLMWLLRPLIQVGARRFRLARTSWNNIRFRFSGTPGGLYRIYLLDSLLLILTLGIYYSWHECKVKRFLRGHSSIGGEAFRYDAKGGDLFGVYFVNGFLTNITLGIYAPWAYAKLYCFHVDHTAWQGARFRCSLSGGEVFSNFFTGLLASVFSLGLALPWAIARWKALHTDSISAHGTMRLDQLKAEHDAEANALAEGLGEAGEALETLGDLFG